MDVRRVVTGHSAADKAVFVSDAAVAPVTLSLLPGMEFHLLWGADAPVHLPGDGSHPSAHEYFPPVGGFRVGLFTVPSATTPTDVSAIDTLAVRLHVSSQTGQLRLHLGEGRWKARRQRSISSSWCPVAASSNSTMARRANSDRATPWCKTARATPGAIRSTRTAAWWSY